VYYQLRNSGKFERETMEIVKQGNLEVLRIRIPKYTSKSDADTKNYSGSESGYNPA
jgi:hypothetical protein